MGVPFNGGGCLVYCGGRSFNGGGRLVYCGGCPSNRGVSSDEIANKSQQ